MTVIPYDRVGAHGEPVPGCDGRLGTDEYRRWAESRFGFTFLGACSIRTTTGGSNWSMHAVKRAIDLGYPQGQRELADLYLAYLTERGGARAEILGVQALHDYAIGEDGSYGTNHARKRMWGHGRAEWRYGNLGNGWFWTHTELMVEVAKNGAEMRRRLDALKVYDESLVGPPAGEKPEAVVDASYSTIDPVRVLDTRGAAKPKGGQTLTVPRHSRVPTRAKALAVNLTMTQSSAPGYVTAWGGGQMPHTSSVNAFQIGQTVANFAIVNVANDGSFRLFTSSGGHLIVDVVGYFA